MKPISAILLMLLFSAPSLAQSVSPKNGNLSVTYTDVYFADHHLGFELSRTYNSKATGKGWFGMGWSSYFETSLTPIPGEGILISHWGGGMNEVFRSNQWNTDHISECIAVLVKVKTEQLEVSTPEEIAALKNKLLNNEELRIKSWKAAVRDSLVRPIELSPGIRLTSTWGGREYVQVLEDGFQLVYEDGKNLLFDSSGRLTKVRDGKSNEIILSYSNDYTPTEMRDTQGNRLAFRFSKNGLIQSVQVEYASGEKASSAYTYNEDDLTLASSRDTGDNYYRYEWDNYYNLTGVLYTDGTDMRITYNEHSFATSLKKKNGSRNVYEYPQVSSDEYGDVSAYYDSTGRLEKKVANWYVIRTTDVGRRWVYRRTVVVNDDSITYVNNERFGVPDTVYLNGGVYHTFEYDKAGEPIRIYENGNLMASIKIKNSMLDEISTDSGTFRFHYEGAQVSKITAPDNAELEYPLTAWEDDAKGFKLQLKHLLPVFKFTTLWYDLKLRD